MIFINGNVSDEKICLEKAILYTKNNERRQIH